MKKSPPARQSVQIIAGIHRHRKIDFIAVNDLRPTGARLRETLFNWLQGDLYGANCLDLFAGSGILGFEALSRGAKSVCFVEKHQQAARQLHTNIATLQIENAEVINSDATKTINTLKKFEVIFLDPPYDLRWLPDLLNRIKILSPQWIFIEDNAPFDDWVNARGDYEIIKSKKAGNIYYGLLRPIME